MKRIRLLRAGMLFLAVAALALSFGCSDSSSGGAVHIVLSGAPATAAGTGGANAPSSIDGSSGSTAVAPLHDGDFHDGPALQSAEVTLSSVLARNLAGELIDLGIDLPVTIDLLGLVDGREFDLPAGSLPPGSYDQIVIVMTGLTLTTLDGTRIEITPPGGGWTRIVQVDPFDVVDGETTTVRILFFRDRSLHWLGDHFDFDPDFEHDDD